MAIGNYLGACLNLFSLTLLLVATIGSWWSWGYVNNSGLRVGFGVGPWVASQLYSSQIPVPCNCNEVGVCSQLCEVVYDRVFWHELTAENACRPNSQVFRTFSGPLNYCHFPEGYEVPELVAPKGATSDNWIGTQEPAPEGTQFIQPAHVPAVQGLATTATILAFLALIAGVVQVASLASFLSLATWVLTLAAFSLWSTFNYTVELLAHRVNVPVWTAGNQSELFGLASDVDYPPFYGASFGTAIAAFILSFFAMLAHAVAINEDDSSSKKADKPAAAPAQPAPAAAAAAAPPAAEAPAAAAPPAQEVSKV